MLQGDESCKINVIILPDDSNNKEIQFNTENDRIVSVNTEGVLTGVSEGETKVTVSAEGGISKEIYVKVIKRLEDGEIVFDDSIKGFYRTFTEANGC